MSRISIIIPVYNGTKFLKTCFDSLTRQSIGMKNLECIFVNDASTDEGASLHMLCDFEKEYPDQVIVVDSQQNHRVGGSRNIGLEYATGDYIAFMDQDDILHPAMLWNMSVFLEKYECDVVMCRFLKFSDERVCQLKRSGPDYVIDITDDLEREKLITSNQLGYVVWDKLYRRDFIYENNIRFPDGKFFEDTFFCGLVSGYLKRLGVMNETYYFYRQYPGSTNESMSRIQRSDLLEVNNKKWEEFVERGIFERCKRAVEYDYLQNYYFGGLKNFSKAYDRIPYDLFQTMCMDVRNKMTLSDIRENNYLTIGLSEFEKCLLELVFCNSDEETWNQIADNISSWA